MGGLWLNYIALFLCVGSAILQYVNGIKYNDGQALVFGTVLLVFAGFNAWVIGGQL